MSGQEIKPTGGQPVWPLSPHGLGQVAVPQWTPASNSVIPEINLATLWRIINEWRWLILGCVAVAAAGSIVFSLLTTPLYRATATLELNPPQIEIMDNNKTQSFASNDRQFLQTQYGLLRSRALAERVAQQLNLAGDSEFLDSEADRATRQRIAAGILAGNFSVEPVAESRLVKISYSSPSASHAARIANGFADGFINTNLERRYDASSYARNFLQSQIRKVKSELERSERLLIGYAQRQQIISTSRGDDGPAGDIASLPGENLIALNSALSEAQTKRVLAEQRFRYFAASGDSGTSNQAATSLRGQQATLEAEYQDKLRAFKPDYPDMVRLRARIDGLNDQIRREMRLSVQERSAALLAEYRSALAQETELRARVAQLKGEVLDLRGRSVQYNILQREVDTNRALYDALLQRYKEIGVAGGIGSNQVSIVDRAEVPGAPYSPNLPFNLLVGLTLGIFAGLAAAVVLEFVNDTVKTPDDVRDKLQLASLGVIPQKQGDVSLAEELKDQTSPVSEAYFSLRTSLQFTTETGAPKTLLITSTRAAEGKSSTTLALAQNFARLGNRVLLIDADLRKPAFVTGSEPQEGLSKLLTNSEPLRQHALKTHFENLWLVPCGPLPPNPAELLSSSRLRQLVAEAASQFDMVIVDGPPVLGLADAPLLGAVTRATLLVVESGKTRTRAAQDAIGRLKAAENNILGAVLTKYRHLSNTYGYNYEPYRYGGIEERDREIQLIAHREA